MTWQPIETASKDERDIVDVWCMGERIDIEFYCSVYSGVRGLTLWQGRVTNVHWKDGAWRQKSGLRLHKLEVTPTHWMPIPDAPHGKDGKAEAWQPIDTAPRRPGHIIVWCPSNRCTHSVSWRDDANHPNGGWWRIWGADNRELYFAPTHWQPAPRRPNTATE